MNINQLSTPSTIATDLRHRQAETLRDIQSILHHPRSLARPAANWRPPSTTLPDGLTMTVTRHRVGARVKARILGFGEEREPSYLVTVRITDPDGPVDPVRAEGWVRALVDNDLVDAVHEVPSGRAATFVWLIDARYLPVHSPAAMFAGLTAAA